MKRRVKLFLGLAVGASAAIAIQACSSESALNYSFDAAPRDSGGSDSGGGVDSGGNDSGGGDAGTVSAMATLQAVGDASTASGTATFTQNGAAVNLVVTMQGAPGGKHGLHVHRGMDCVAPGPHYGPDGGPYHGEYAITLDDAGMGTLSVAATDVTVAAGPWTVVGHAMVFHALPVPDAGGPAPRAACGVLQLQ